MKEANKNEAEKGKKRNEKPKQRKIKMEGNIKQELNEPKIKILKNGKKCIN
jgi:hypothetical protein